MNNNPTSPPMRKRSRLAVTSLVFGFLAVAMIGSCVVADYAGPKSCSARFWDVVICVLVLSKIAGLSAVGFGFSALVVLKRSRTTLFGVAMAIVGICMGAAAVFFPFPQSALL
ncbi:MAG: hypothetical protein WA117_15010 [Verrucomicrobiia bacterium]